MSEEHRVPPVINPDTTGTGGVRKEPTMNKDGEIVKPRIGDKTPMNEKDIELWFGAHLEENKKIRGGSNGIRTSKYTWYSWAPLSLLFQFKRAANIYFLWISILTCMPFSPKNPASMIYTFAGVLFFTMLKELYEDIHRMRGDRKENNKKCPVLNKETGEFTDHKWKNLKLGDVV